MRCNICGESRFVATEYRTGDVTAPALECTRCHAIVLEEAVARTEKERESVRMAIAARTAAMHDRPPHHDDTAIETEPLSDPDGLPPEKVTKV